MTTHEMILRCQVMHSFVFGSGFCHLCSLWKSRLPPTCGSKYAAAQHIFSWGPLVLAHDSPMATTITVPRAADGPHALHVPQGVPRSPLTARLQWAPRRFRTACAGQCSSRSAPPAHARPWLGVDGTVEPTDGVDSTSYQGSASRGVGGFAKFPVV